MANSFMSDDFAAFILRSLEKQRMHYKVLLAEQVGNEIMKFSINVSAIGTFKACEQALAEFPNANIVSAKAIE